MAGTSLRVFTAGKPANPPVINGLTFALDAAVAAWVTAQGINPRDAAGNPLQLWSAPILVGATAGWQAGNLFFTEFELVQWQAELQAALAAKAAYQSALATYQAQILTTCTAQNTEDATPSGPNQTALNTALATLATNHSSLLAAERTYADSLAVLKVSDVGGRANIFYNPLDFPAIRLAGR